MSVSSSEISKAKNQTYGVRCDFKYALEDGRETFVRSVRFKSLEDANKSLTERIPQVEERFRDLDAKEAVSLNISTPHKTATQGDVWFAYLYDGYNTESAVEAYNKMSKAAPQILALNLTIEQMAEMFDEPVETAQSVMDRWSYLDMNKADIINYENIESGL